ncbi:MAG: fibronectin type III domain-containing protein [Verrucomicrobia bacterium]|nr:fibronectin type III domain-containing protein [Verrucomicrobiota bacterium]MCH8512140.1 fibronectin type III domain-containing protein [Kiritimatiellia bacterium]
MRDINYPYRRRFSALLFVLLTCLSLQAHAVEPSDITGRAGGEAGLVVLVEPSGSQTAIDLADAGKHVIVALSSDPQLVDQFDEAFVNAEVHPIADAQQWRNTAALPFQSNAVNVLVLSQAQFDALGEDEVTRVIAPAHGVALVGDDLTEIRKERPEGMDVWLGRNRDATGNNLSRDTVQPPNSIQWLGGARGIPAAYHIISERVHFVSGNNPRFQSRYTTQFGNRPRNPHARDAFSGVTLWNERHTMGEYLVWPFIAFSDGERLFLPQPQAGNTYHDGRDNEPLFMESRNILTGQIIEESLPLIQWNDRLENQEIQMGHWNMNNFFTYRVISDEQRIYHADGGNIVRALSADGTQLLWEKTFPAHEYTDMLAIDQNGEADVLAVVLASTDNNPFASMRLFERHDNIATAVVGLNPATGEQLWRYDGVHDHALKFIIMEFGHLVVSSHLNDPQKAQETANNAGVPSYAQVANNFLASLDPATGQERFRRTGVNDFMDVPMLTGHRANLALSEDYIIFNEAGVAYVFDAMTGERVHENSAGRTSRYTRFSGATKDYIIRNNIFTSYDGTEIDNTTDLVTFEDYGGFNKAANNMWYVTSGFRSSASSRYIGETVALVNEPSFPEFVPYSERLLVAGTAQGSLAEEAGDWPTFRGDFKRRGWRTVDGPEGPLELAWSSEIDLSGPEGAIPYVWTMNSDSPGAITQPVVDGNQILISVPDRHKLVSLNLLDGAERWSTRLSGRVAAPPTLAGDVAFVGVNDGTVSAIDLSDGSIIWTFLAAPYERLHNAHSQMESTHPVRSSPVLYDGTLYVSAGRHTNIDNGIYVWALDPTNGEPINHRVLNDPENNHINDIMQVVDGRLRIAYTDIDPDTLERITPRSPAPAVYPVARGHDGGHGWIGPVQIWMGANFRSGTGMYEASVAGDSRTAVQQEDRFIVFRGASENVYLEFSADDHDVVLREFAFPENRFSRRFMEEYMFGAGRFSYLVARRNNDRIGIAVIDPNEESFTITEIDANANSEEIIPDGIAIAHDHVIVTTTTGRVLAFAQPRIPEAPSDLVVEPGFRTQLELTWQDNAWNEQTYHVERSADGSNWTEIAALPEGSDRYLDEGLESDTTYHYRVAASNITGISEWSAVASGTTIPDPTHPPTAASNLEVSVVSDSEIELNWTVNSDDEDGFLVERSQDGFTWEEVASLDRGTSGYIDGGLISSTQYWYRVVAYSIAGQSAASNSASEFTLSLGQEISSLFVINQGTINEETGQFSRNGGDEFQGVVAHFEPVSLDEVGSFVDLTFEWSGGAGDNTTQGIVWGLYNGSNVNADAQTNITSAWEGYFHAIGVRSGNSRPSQNSGMYRQGAGPQPLINHAIQDGTFHADDVDGAGGRLNSNQHELAYHGQPITGVVRLERISETEIRYTTVYETGRDDRNNTGSAGGISYRVKGADGEATFYSTHNVSAGGPTTVNAVVFGGRGNFNVQNVVVRSTSEDENGGGDPPPVEPPAAPVDLIASTASAEQILVSWEAGDALAEQFVLESRASGGNWEPLATVSADVLDYAHGGLSPSTTYHYRVLARNEGGDSPWSAEASAITADADEPAPPVITAQPQSQSVIEGVTVAFTVTAFGQPSPDYQWYFNDDEIPGETSATLEIPNVGPANEGSYHVLISNHMGYVESESAALLVGPASESLLVRYTFENVPSISDQHSASSLVRQADAEFADPGIVASPFHIRNFEGSNAEGKVIATDSENGIAGAAQIAGEQSALFQWESGGSGNAYYEFTLDGLGSLEVLRIVSRSGQQWTNSGGWNSYSAARRSQISIRTSLDNYGANVGTVFTAGDNGEFNEELVDLTMLSLTDQAVTFRVYTRSLDPSGSWHRTQVDRVEVLGSPEGSPPDLYDLWVEDNNIVGGPTDLTGGVPNLWRYALGGAADTPSNEFNPRPELDGGRFGLRFQRVADPNLTYEVWATDDLMNWGAAPIWTSTGAENVEGETVVEDVELLQNQTLRFMRLIIRLTGIDPVVIDPPEITQQPISQVILIGETAVFSVSATSDASLTYQWYLNDEPISGANSPTLEISNAQSVDEGLYRVVVSNAGGAVAVEAVSLTTTPPLTSPELFARVNFQTDDQPAPEGWLKDSGKVFGDRGNGFSYGWSGNITDTARQRNNNSSPDFLHDTLVHMQKDGEYTWEIEVPNGEYQVRIIAGDPSHDDSVYAINAEETRVVEGTPDANIRWFEGEEIVSVGDGRLIISNASNAQNNKIAFLEIHFLPSEPNPLPPSSPIGLSAQVGQDSQVLLTWDPVDSETETLHVERSLDGETWVLLTSLDGASVETEDHDVSAGATYWYRLIAENEAGQSDSSAAVSVTLPQEIEVLGAFFTINQGSYDAETGQFGRDGNDVFQGVVAHFDPVELSEPGDFVELTFDWNGGASTNTSQGIVWGLFNGDQVNDHAQTEITAGWEGYFHAIGVREGNSRPSQPSGMYRQGSGPQPLINHATQDGTFSAANDIDGAGGRLNSNVHELPYHGRHSITGVIRLERISETEIRYTTFYETERSDRNNTGWEDGISYRVKGENGDVTFYSTHTVADGVPGTVNALVMAGRDTFHLSNVSLSSSGGSAPTPVAPTTPSGFTATGISESEISLAWTDTSSITETFVLSYRPEGGSWSELATLPASDTEYLHEGLSPSSNYEYRILARNQTGDSNWSETILAGTMDPPLAPPSSPSGLSAQIGQDSQVLLIWEPVDPETENLLLDRSTDGGNWIRLAELPGDATGFVDDGTENETLYQYRLAAENPQGMSDWTDPVEVVTPPAPQQTPETPSNLTPTAVTTQRINLTWEEIGDQADQVEIERSQSGTDWSTIAVIDAGIEFHADLMLDIQTSYSYRLRALNAVGASDWTSVVNATTHAHPDPVGSWYAINDGHWNDQDKTFVRNGEDSLQGVVANFPPVEMAQEGDFVEIEFSWNGGASNNTTQGIVWGLFNGEHVTDHAQTHITGGWEGYFHAIGVREGNSRPSQNSGMYRQGSGPQPLVNHATQEGTFSANDVDGAGGRLVSNVHELAYHGKPINGVIRLERVSETQIRYTTFYQTEREDRNHTGSADGISYRVQGEYGNVTFYSTHTVADGGPTTINSLVFAGRGNFTLKDLTLYTSHSFGFETQVPVSPTGLLGDSLTPRSIVLTWQDPADNADGYELQRSEDGANWSTIAALPFGETEFIDVGLEPETTYHYRVANRNARGTSDWSEIVSVTTLTPVVPLPDVPVDLQAESFRVDHALLSWGYSDERADFVQIERRTGDEPWTVAQVLDATETAWEDEGLQPGTSYEYRMFAFNEGGESHYTDTVGITTSVLPKVNEGIVSTSTFLGGSSEEDAVLGSVILSDGTIVLAANLSDAIPDGVPPMLLHGATKDASGAIVRLSSDGRRVLSVTRVSSRVTDLSADANDNLYVAAWEAGILKLNSTATAVIWNHTDPEGRNPWRVDTSDGGTVVALFHGAGLSNPHAHNPGTGRIHVLSPAGEIIGNFAGRHNTLDVAVHEDSETVIFIGWRQANSWQPDGSQQVLPVQISYFRGVDYVGNVKYTGYDWPTDTEHENFLNRSNNNMADTRGIRASIGRDGYLYLAFEAAGGNHIFRYSPFDIMEPVDIVHGDWHHQFFNSNAEHKTFFARYEAETGEYLTGQEFCGRLSSGEGNGVRPLAIEADEEGRVFLSGRAAAGMPLSWNPPGTGAYSGGSWLMIMSPDFTTREFMTRMAPGGTAYTVATRRIDGYQHLVLAGATTTPSLFLKDPIQSEMNAFVDGFYTVFAPDEVPVEPMPGDLPSAPYSLYANVLAYNSVALEWQHNSDQEYGYRLERAPQDGGDWTAVGNVVKGMFSFVDQTAEGSTTYQYRVRALNDFGVSDPSNVVTLTTPPPPREPDTVVVAQSGLHYAYYEGTWSEMPEFNSLIPVEEGVTPQIDLDLRLRDQQYAFVFEGFVEVDEEGVYTFTTRSKGTIRLWIGDALVVEHDGLDPNEEVSGDILLFPGYHAFRVEYFTNDPDGFQEVLFSFEGGEGEIIPGSRFLHESSVPVMVMADNSDEDVVEVIGTWTTSTFTGGGQFIGEDYLHDGDSNKGQRSVIYQAGLVEGLYEVQIIYSAFSNRASNVPVTIHHAEGSETVTVNQQSGGGIWHTLGTYSFESGFTGHVVISNAGTNGFVIADAIRFVPVTP